MDELLRILVCPESKQRLRVADAPLLDRLNGLIDRGFLTNRDGARVTERLEAGLVREDGRWLYPVRGGIPIMLFAEAIALDALEVADER